MVHIHVAYSAPINPSDSESVLSRSQVWAGLQRKIRNAPEFVGAITSCEVIEEKYGVVTREVVFGAQPDKKVKEVCQSYWPMKVDFHQTDGSIISNIISDGPSGEETDLYMTYAFQWLHPKVEEGSEEAEELTKKHKGVAKMAVDKSIEAIRRLVKEGKIEA